MMVTHLPAWLALLGPAALAAASASPSGSLGRFRAAGALALATALAAAVAVACLGPIQSGTLGMAGIGLSVYLDPLSVTMDALVAFIGLIVIAFSITYLEGDAGRLRFMRLLAATVASVLVIVLSGNVAVLVLSWIAMSLALDGLLRFYAERPFAVLAARKRFVIARIGEAFLLVAALLIYAQLHTLDYSAIFAAVRDGALSPSFHVVALCIVVAAMLQSAQFPLHGWLTEVMEAPTPVSALLHAGIVNAGGFLVLRFATLEMHAFAALEVLAIVGACTALFGSVVMLTQTSIKVALAYSTIAQMGFMMLECGLGAFPAALLHIVAHSFYKAHAFLSSGSVIDITRTAWTPGPAGAPNRARRLVVASGVGAVLASLAFVFRVSPFAQPGLFALGIVASLGVITLIASGLDERPNPYVLATTLGWSALVALAYVALQVGSQRIFAGSLPHDALLHGPLAAWIAVGVVACFAVVTYVQSLLPGNGGTLRWRRAYVWIANGLYVNTLANRLLLRAWPDAGRTLTEER
ncbi:MAG: NADH-quinone oxidoreductase subunit L [bacterium]|nr:NADH-quinone oxidoreductase subunit L [bacterium]